MSSFYLRNKWTKGLSKGAPSVTILSNTLFSTLTHLIIFHEKENGQSSAWADASVATNDYGVPISVLLGNMTKTDWGYTIPDESESEYFYISPREILFIILLHSTN